VSKKVASPDAVLAALQAGATTRTQNSLNIIHAICAEQCKAGNRDFSVATIGRLSSGRGGPSTQAIRNKPGEHYRTLLLAWASQADGAARKPPSKPATSLESEILDMIEDPCVCALVGSILAEIRHLRNENTVLKMSASTVIDRRPLPEARGTPPNPGAQLFSPLSLLLPLEVEALRFAVSDQFLESMGWILDSKTGRVSRGERAIFRAGFGTAIKKIVDAAKQ
jgi:hypothetical protein